jgi:hypothetical protein
MILTGPIRNSDICYTCVHLFLTVQATFLWYYYQQTEPEICPHSAQRAGQSPQHSSTITTERRAMTSHPMNCFKSISKSVLQLDYCAVKRPPPPLYFLCQERLMLNKSDTELNGFELSFIKFRIADHGGA